MRADEWEVWLWAGAVQCAGESVRGGAVAGAAHQQHPGRVSPIDATPPSFIHRQPISDGYCDSQMASVVLWPRSRSTQPLLPDTGITSRANAAALQLGSAMRAPTAGSLKP